MDFNARSRYGRTISEASEAFEIWNLVLELGFPLYYELVAIHAPFCINYLFISRLLSNDVNFEILLV